MVSYLVDPVLYLPLKYYLLEKYQLDIVKADGLGPLLRLLQSAYLPLILSSTACVRNVSIHPQNESPIIEAGFLHPGQNTHLSHGVHGALPELMGQVVPLNESYTVLALCSQ